MKNSDYWKETKIESREDKFYSNKNYGIGSYLISNLVIQSIVSFIDFKALNEKSKILDIGCGKMPHFTIFKKYISPKNYIGIDWSNSPHPNDNIDYYIDLNSQDLIKFLSENDDFDIILLLDVLEHLSNPESALEAISKLLNKRPTSYALVSIPFFYWIHEKPYDFNRFTIFKLEKMFEASELHIEQMEVKGGFGLALLDLLSKNIFRKLYLNNGLFRTFLIGLNNFFDKIGLNSNDTTYPIEYIIKLKGAKNV